MTLHAGWAQNPPAMRKRWVILTAALIVTVPFACLGGKVVSRISRTGWNPQSRIYDAVVLSLSDYSFKVGQLWGLCNIHVARIESRFLARREFRASGSRFLGTGMGGDSLVGIQPRDARGGKDVSCAVAWIRHKGLWRETDALQFYGVTNPVPKPADDVKGFEDVIVCWNETGVVKTIRDTLYRQWCVVLPGNGAYNQEMLRLVLADSSSNYE